MARRQRVLGLPIGKKKPRIPTKAWVAGASLAAVPAAVGARRVGDLVSTGRRGIEKASDLAGTASHVAEAMSSHGSTLGKVGAAVSEMRELGGHGGSTAPKLSHVIEEHIEVAVARSVAYNQWTQFETFPSITKGTEQVEQQGRDKVTWTSRIGPSRRSWQGEITEQVPDERIAWRGAGGLQLKGVVTFHSLDDDLTRVLVQMEYDPCGAVETVGNLLRVQRRRVRRDLRLFKHFLELRGDATGAWRNRIAKKDGGGGARDSGESGSSSRSTGERAGRATSAAKRAARSATKSPSSPKASSSRSQSSKDRSSGAAKSGGSRQPSRRGSGTGRSRSDGAAKQSRAQPRRPA